VQPNKWNGGASTRGTDGHNPSDSSHSANSHSDGGERAPDVLSQVDAALMRLDIKLEAVGREFVQVEAQVSPFFDQDRRQPTVLLKNKWVSTALDWEAVQKDADVLGDELKEDKWLVVFRTVSGQAEDMVSGAVNILRDHHTKLKTMTQMKSLEKVLTQSHEFIWDLNRRQVTSSSNTSSQGHHDANTLPSYFSDPLALQPLLSSFSALHQSLHAKVKYYSPACDRVLKILGKGIADRSTKNGEVLRRFAEMKARWRNLLDRIGRIEGEMRGVEAMLNDAAGEQTVGTPSRPTARLTPSKATPDPVERMSPFRKLASKLTPNRTPPVSTSAPSSASRISRPAASPSAARPAANTTLDAGSLSTPPRPPKSVERLDSGSKLRRMSQLPQDASPTTGAVLRQSTHTTSANLLPVPDPYLNTSQTRSMRSASPAPSADGSGSKPRWNISTKRAEEREVIREGASLGVGRLSLGTVGRSNNRLSQSYGGGRSSIGGGSARAPSPAFSNFSDGSAPFVRQRVSSASKIPAPSPATPSSRHQGPAAFSSLDNDEQPTSLLQRTMTPTPSSTAPRSRAPPAASPSRGLSPPPRRTSSPGPIMSRYSRGQTPEPTLIAHARRIAHVRAPYFQPPPVPSIPSNYRDSATTPTPKPTRKPPSTSRPPSSLSNSNRSNSHSHTSQDPHASSPSGPYLPNPIDALDVQVALVLNSLPIQLHIEKLDPPLTRASAAVTETSGLSGRYLLALGTFDQRRAVMLKLVDRLGPRASKGEKKVLVRVGGGYQDLESFALGLLAVSV
jgi:hypothetical protein